ncbi:ATP-binding cassette domain-containing protein [Virgisporangium aurantiacum]|uniref:Daunorubicin resistance protein DrrA family ABC transporter ATP-binding protein n=1 Tax=Virgisporangium aurantiacum TaxID=175570 RepID=A0A8J4DYZ4_9ACTN|nr:ATP-binding cassette domain-containing protein [Virgisporangium aurantiacum]GIJ53547.1 daunorubicin resistance protein DrrA family ABC transporter ATP-binding protein [Virgisporangium aurantiacum]
MIKTSGLRKSFRSGRTTVDAVRGVDLDVGDGEIFGFLGPNGAGKTTTLRMLATLIRPDGGSALVAGIDLRQRPGEVRRRIGYVAQGGGTWDEVSAREELAYQVRLYGIGPAEARRRAHEAVDAFQLTEFADRHCKTYSGGQRRRVDIALGVIHRPRVVFLDEPTTGLDPQSRAHMWNEVRRLRDEGMTIFLTTHYLEEADALCDRVAIIDHGTIVAVDSPAELKRQVAGDVVTLDLADDPTTVAADLERQPYVRELERSGDNGLRLVVDAGATAMPQIMRHVDAAGATISAIELHRPSLDDVFLARTGRSLRDTGSQS